MRNYFLFKRKLFVYFFLSSLISLHKLVAKALQMSTKKLVFYSLNAACLIQR